MFAYKTSARHLVSLALLAFLCVGPVGVALAQQVKVTSAEPASAAQGTTSLDVTIGGSGFDGSAAVKFLLTGTTNPGGIVVTKVVVVNPKKLVATIDVEGDAVVGQFDIEVSLSSDRKGKGTTLFSVSRKAADPCATVSDFPAFAFVTEQASVRTLYVADSAGTCVRKLQDNASTNTKFSYPVDGQPNRGRVVWGATSTYAQDFTVGPGNTVNVDPPRLVDAGCCRADLSQDGSVLYVVRSGNSISAVRIDSPGSETVLYAPGETGWSLNQVSVAGDDTTFFGARIGRGPDGPDWGSSKLVRIDLTDGSETVLREWPAQSGYGYHSPFPAADKYADRVAFVDRVLGTNNCWPLVVTDHNGAVSFAGSVTGPVGNFPTWVGDRVVMERSEPIDRKRKCSGTSTIQAVELATGAETPLTTGRFPDGR
jgi:hypothetical protein